MKEFEDMNYYLSLMQSIYSVSYIREKDGKRKEHIKHFSSRKQAEDYANKISEYNSIIKIVMLLDGKYLTLLKG